MRHGDLIAIAEDAKQYNGLGEVGFYVTVYEVGAGEVHTWRKLMDKAETAKYLNSLTNLQRVIYT